MCVDTPTGYNCTCFTGYQLASDMINCTGTILTQTSLFCIALMFATSFQHALSKYKAFLYHPQYLSVARDSIPLSLLLTDYSIV